MTPLYDKYGKRLKELTRVVDKVIKLLQILAFLCKGVSFSGSLALLEAQNCIGASECT